MNLAVTGITGLFNTLDLVGVETQAGESSHMINLQ
jgi:hypothetical protein